MLTWSGIDYIIHSDVSAWGITKSTDTSDIISLVDTEELSQISDTDKIKDI